MTMADLDLRVSDADREHLVERLRRAAGEGRLDLAELDERLTAAYAARTRGDLEALVRDLPRERERDRGRHPAGVTRQPDFVPYLGVMALLVAIWALTGMGYFWPVWPALGWGLGLVLRVPACRKGRRAV
jgi:Domain of unknown function (DUF1707)/2TM domain